MHKILRGYCGILHTECISMSYLKIGKSRMHIQFSYINDYVLKSTQKMMVNHNIFLSHLIQIENNKIKHKKKKKLKKN